MLSGTLFESIIRVSAQQGLVLDAAGRIDEWVADRLEKHRNPGAPHTQQRAEGLWVQISEQKARNGGTVGVYSDITEIKRTEADLREKTEFLRLNHVITRAANKAVSVSQTLRFALNQVCAYTEWPVGHAYLPANDEAGELEPTNIWHLNDTEHFETFRCVSEATRIVSGVGLMGRVLASGKPVWIIDVTKDPKFARAKLATEIGLKAGVAFPVLVGKEVAGVLEFFSDSAIEPYEPLLEVMGEIGTQLGRAIDRQRADEQQKVINEIKDKNLGAAAHGLIPPISSIRGMSQMLVDPELDKDIQRSFLETISRVSEQMLILVNDLLDVSVIQSGKIEIKRIPGNLSALSKECAGILAILFKDKDITLMTALDEVPDSLIDVGRMRQVIDNLLSNALKYSHSGTTVCLACRKNNEGLEISVTDQGVGIPEKELGKLFRAFEKLNTQPTAGEKSTGLGLSIVKSIVDLHNGEIAVDSKVGKGSTFTVSIPLDPGS